LFAEEGYPLNQKITAASRGVSHFEELELMGLLQEMIDRLGADFDFERAKIAAEAHVNRTTEPVVHFLVWLERTPEAHVASRSAFQRLTNAPSLR
jgi:hypothetical protein